MPCMFVTWVAASSDRDILAHALSEGRIVITADSDFAWMHALAGSAQPSVIQFREGTTRRPAQQLELLLANLPILREDLGQGAIVIFGDSRMRIRPLPILR